jgi:NitT/TauT family transport system permease protein
LIHLFLMHKATPAQILFKLRLPHALPNLFVGIRISAGISVIGAITGELFAGSSRVGEGGLGYSILYASSQLETDYLFALVLAATVLGFLSFLLVCFWSGTFCITGMSRAGRIFLNNGRYAIVVQGVKQDASHGN